MSMLLSMYGALWLFTATQPDSCANNVDLTNAANRPFICSNANANAGPSLNWPSKRAHFQINKAGTQQIEGDAEFSVIRQAFQTWSHVDNAQFTFIDDGLSEERQVGFNFLNVNDNQNLVMFQSKWAHDQDVIGLTTATYNADTGEIFDADIELNEQYFTFTVGDSGVKTDLLNTVTHEVGHFVGFDHTDKPGSAITRLCAINATMAQSTRIGEIQKRTLAPTDKLGMAFVYPQDPEPVHFCVPPSTNLRQKIKIEQTSEAYPANMSHGKSSGCQQQTWSDIVMLPVGVLCFFIKRRLKRLA